MLRELYVRSGVWPEQWPFKLGSVGSMCGSSWVCCSTDIRYVFPCVAEREHWSREDSDEPPLEDVLDLSAECGAALARLGRQLVKVGADEAGQRVLDVLDRIRQALPPVLSAPLWLGLSPRYSTERIRQAVLSPRHPLPPCGWSH